MIGIAGGFAAPPLPHHRTCGSAYGGSGERVGDQTFRAWPMSGGKPGFFSLFAFAWNMPSRTVPLVYASNGAGNAVTGPIAFQFPKKEQPNYTVHDLQANDRFIQKVVGELDPTKAAR